LLRNARDVIVDDAGVFIFVADTDAARRVLRAVSVHSNALLEIITLAIHFTEITSIA
jgi:hypothetical protein